jgi:hypothetical protein
MLARHHRKYTAFFLWCLAQCTGGWPLQPFWGNDPEKVRNWTDQVGKRTITIPDVLI